MILNNPPTIFPPLAPPPRRGPPRGGGAVLFSKGEGIILMSLLLYFAECVHFNRLQDTVCPGYRWEDYFHDLKHDPALWHTVLTAFRDAIQRLDFKADWLEVGIDHGP